MTPKFLKIVCNLYCVLNLIILKITLSKKYKFNDSLAWKSAIAIRLDTRVKKAYYEAANNILQ